MTATPSALEPVQELGRTIEARFRAIDYDEHRFAALAAAALSERNLPGLLDPWEALRAFHQTEPMPEQRDVDARFSDLPVTLYNGHGFYIDAYFWLDGTTEIHQHAFAGAFQVWSGASLHTRYAFARERELNPHFLIGRLEVRDVEILRRGDIRPIIPGPSSIHSLFHLDRPSITLTVRTHHTPTAAPQYSYLRPSLAVHPFHRDAGLAKMAQQVTVLLKMRHPEADQRIRELLLGADFPSAFRLLETAAHHLPGGALRKALGLGAPDEDRLGLLIEAARPRHGSLVDLVRPAIEERQRQTAIANLRATMTSEDHRFLLALLLNLSERSRVVDLVALWRPDQDPVETIVDWVEELGMTREAGSEINILGLRGWDDDHVFVFEGLLRGWGPSDLEAEAATRFSPEQAEALRARIPALAESLRGTLLFRSLLIPPTSG